MYYNGKHILVITQLKNIEADAVADADADADAR